MTNRKYYYNNLIEKFNQLHNTKYLYPDKDWFDQNYKNTDTMMCVHCPIHGPFNITVDAHVYRKRGCKLCSKYRICKEEFIIKSKNVYGENFFDYSLLGEWKGMHTKTLFRCIKHDYSFKQKPCDNLTRNGCKVCDTERRTLTLEDVLHNVNKSSIAFMYRFDLLTKHWYDQNYAGNNTKLPIICPIHGTIYVKYRIFINGHGCAKCADASKISKVCLIWLLYIEYIHKIKIIPEYKIPNTRLVADGFCKETNTIYEFYGDYFHGNPNKQNKKSKYQQYFLDKTLKRAEKIKSMGYNLNNIWEADFMQNVLPNVPKIIRDSALKAWMEYQKRA